MEEDDGTLVLPIFKKLSKKKKSTINLAHKTKTKQEEDEGEDPIQPEGNAVVSRLSRKSTLKATPTKPLSSRLSLGEASDQSFQSSSKPSSRRKLARPDSQASLNNLTSNDNSTHSSPLSLASRPTYSAVDLKELQSLTLSTSSSRSNADTLDELTRSKFPGHRALEEDEDDEMIDAEISNQSISSVLIPTSTFITSAKESRLQARKIGLSSSQLLANDISSSEASTAEDFISLSGRPSSSMIPLVATKNGESRLVREEDQFGEGDDEHAEYTGAKERVPLGEKAGLAAEAHKKADMEAMILDTQDDLQEGSLEELEWEAAQIRRGGIGIRHEKNTTEQKPNVYQPAPIPEHTSLASLESLESRSLNLLHLVEQSVAEQTEAAVRFTNQEKSLSNQDSELDQEIKKEASKLKFFTELEEFIKEIDLFFISKFPKLEKIEQELLSILTERAELIFKRRYQDLSDDLVLFKSGEIGVTRPATKKKLNNSSKDLMEEEDKEDQENGESVDELGRTRPEFDISPHAPSRTSRRNERLQRRKRRIERKLAEKLTSQGEEEDEGFSTDDSLSPADSSDLKAASKALIESGRELLKDVENPIFLSPTNQGSVCDRFIGWRKKYPEQYDQAFGNLGLVQAWEFWVRFELVTGLNLWGFRDWMMLDDKRGIENWQWMRGLEHYDHSLSLLLQEEEENQSDGSHQESVIAAMISTVVIPFLIPIIKASYDPFSVNSNTRSLLLAEQVSYFLDTMDNPTYDQFILSFLDRFRLSIFELEHLLLLSHSKKNDDEGKLNLNQVGQEAILGTRRFLFKCFKLFHQGLRWKLFFNKLYWNPTSPPILHQENDSGSTGSCLDITRPFNFKYILVNHLLVRVIFPLLFGSWNSGGQLISNQILEICPSGFLDDHLVTCLKNGHESNQSI